MTSNEERLEKLIEAYRTLAKGYSSNSPGMITHAQHEILKLEKKDEGVLEVKSRRKQHQELLALAQYNLDQLRTLLLS